MLQVRNIEKYYGNRNNLTKALDRVSFEVADGEFIAIMGASLSRYEARFVRSKEKYRLRSVLGSADSVQRGIAARAEPAVHHKVQRW